MSGRHQWLDGVARGVAVTVLFLTAVDALFSYIPFTATQVIRGRLIEPLSQFADWHQGWAAVAAGLIWWILRGELRARRLDALGLAAAVAALAALNVAWPVLPQATSGTRGFITALVAFVLMLWLVAVEVRTLAAHLTWATEPPDDDARLGGAFGWAALYVTAVSVCVWWSRAPATPAIGTIGVMATLAWTASLHATVFGGLFVALMFIRALAVLTPQPARTEFTLGWVLATGLLAFVLQAFVFAAIAFTGPRAIVAGAVSAAALAGTFGTSALRTAAGRDGPVRSGLAIWLSPAGRRRPLAVAALMALAPVGIWATNVVAQLDWNFLVQTLMAIGVWSLAIMGFFALLRPSRRWPASLLVGLAVLAPVGMAATEASVDRRSADQLATFDPSFRALYQSIVPNRSGAPDIEFFRYLVNSTNIRRERRIDPAPIRFVRTIAPSPGPRPNIFIIVVDSLRRDYLSPFNPAVTFTPDIAALAADSDVYSRAFTHYGATGLSEPSIWAGSLLVHKQYVTPFAPMNALATLVDSDGYRQFVSVDSILRTLLTPSPNLTELDAGRPTKDYDLCQTLPELQRDVESARGSGQPLFAYTQPQNLHVSAIARAGKSVPEGEHYPGFFDPYASRVRRLDRCVGQFVSYLKTAGLYDNSIVVVTSDHGDSLGEEGRFGHAYTLFPEVVRIPLILHVPPRLRTSLATDHDAPVFSTDITPTLYALLGHTPTFESDLLGRPLLFPRDGPRPAPRTDYLVVSSYGPVYGLIDGQGRRLYIADGVAFEDHAFDLSSLVGTRVAVTATDRTAGRRRVREHVAGINRFFGFDPDGP